MFSLSCLPCPHEITALAGAWQEAASYPVAHAHMQSKIHHSTHTHTPSHMQLFKQPQRLSPSQALEHRHSIHIHICAHTHHASLGLPQASPFPGKQRTQTGPSAATLGDLDALGLPGARPSSSWQGIVPGVQFNLQTLAKPPPAKRASCLVQEPWAHTASGSDKLQVYLRSSLSSPSPTLPSALS